MEQQVLEYFGDQNDTDGIDRLQVTNSQAIINEIVRLAKVRTQAIPDNEQIDAI